MAKAQLQISYIDQAYEKALDALQKCITSKGFSACSIADDPEDHTNYNSVWARDSAITGLWTLPLNNPDFIQATKQSLQTILDAQAVNGTLPNYVYVDHDEIEYGGVSNISAIDGALWTIIAAWGYYDHTKDEEFLAHYSQHIDKCYQWLAAHDSNNCGLLEIPESSDWADLMYRSYNVLYDEVLWYAATQCYMSWKKAGGQPVEDLVGRADHIKNQILLNFWPTEDSRKNNTVHDKAQFNLIHTPYLIEQVGPHSYGWRCDVYANLLASYYGITDDTMRRTTYDFLRQVEIDEPYPVKVLYPPVDTGDPMWRDYQLVKLHNIPNHYHNGGIWPLAGGLWVQFLNKIGETTHAEKALTSLAEFCHQGLHNDWEFNEWGHGQTGKPMGKGFQGWSAASYIAAYLDHKKSE